MLFIWSRPHNGILWGRETNQFFERSFSQIYFPFRSLMNIGILTSFSRNYIPMNFMRNHSMKPVFVLNVFWEWTVCLENEKNQLQNVWFYSLAQEISLRQIWNQNILIDRIFFTQKNTKLLIVDFLIYPVCSLFEV